jgi:hypothetical protein
MGVLVRELTCLLLRCAMRKQRHGRLALLALTLVGELRVTAEPGRARLTP